MASPGSLIEYFQSKRLVCALCLKSDNKDNLFVRTEDNREDKVAKAKVVFQWAGFAGDPTSDTVVSALKQASGRRDQVAASVQLAELWELLVDDAESLALGDLGELYFSKSPSPEETSGLFRALENDRIYFTRKAQSYIPRTRALVDESLQRLRIESERGQEKEATGKWLRQLWDGTLSAADLSEQTRSRYFTWIRDVAVLGTEAPKFKEVQALFKELEIGGKDAAFRLMVKAGLWTEDEFLLLHKYHPSDAFSAELVEEGRRAAETLPAKLAERVDLLHLECFTIDDADTTEIDDALSLEVLPEGGYRLGIHIADASAFVEPGTELDKESMDRGTCIYLPERKYRMLPELLGDFAISLVAGEDRLAFSFLVTLDADYQVASEEMALTKIRVRQRLTYDEADALLASADKPGWAPLLPISEALRSQRAANGAVTLPFPRILIKVTPGPEIFIQRETPNAPSQLIVSEMMIRANRMAGECCVKNGLPALFRSQPAPEKPIPTDVDYTPEVLFKLRRLFKRGEIGLDPARHAGLGLDAYIQATSPIRRYSDMVAQRQLKSLLQTGEAFYTREEIEPIMHNLERTSSQADHLEKERRQFWTLRWLEVRRFEEMDAIVLQNMPEKHVVQIVPVLYETDCPHVSGRPLPPGSRIKVRIELVWPREHVVRVTPVLDDDDED